MLSMLPLLGGDSYLGLDLTRMDHGMFCELRARLAAGDGFWLSPVLGNGEPLLANSATSLFYLPRWLALAFPPQDAASAFVVLHLVLAAAGAAWLARTFGLRPGAATAAGLAYAWSGVVVDLIVHSMYLLGAAWLPWVWAAGRRALARPGEPAPVGLLVVSLLGLLWGGEPQCFVVSVVLVAAESARRVRGWRPPRGTARVVAAGVCAGLLGLVQWAPTLASAVLSPRLGGLSLDGITVWSFRQPAWPATMLPGVFNQTLAGGLNLWLLDRDATSMDFPWVQAPYLGPLVLVGALLGWRRRRMRFVLVAASVGLVLALGDETPVFGALLRVFPPLGTFRYPAKYLPLVALGVTLAACASWQGLMRRRSVDVAWLWAAGGALAAFGAGAAVVAGQANVLDAVLMLPPGEAAPALGPLLSQVLLEGTARAAALVALSLGLVWWRRGRVVWGVVLVLDLMLAARAQLPTGPPLPPSPLTALGPQAVVCTPNALSNLALTTPNTTPAWRTAAMARLLAFPDVNACDGVASGVPYSMLITRLNHALEVGLTHRYTASARALGCTHVLFDRPPVDATAHVVPNVLPFGPNAALRVYAVEDAIPVAFVVPQPVFQTEALVLQHIPRARTWPAVTALVDDPLAPPQDAHPVLPLGDGARVVGLAWPVRHQAQVVLDGRGGALVGLRTAFHVGWHASQAGRPLRVVRVAGTLVAAVVEDVTAGPVDWEYRAPLFWQGVAAAVLGLFGVLVLLARQRPSRARSKDVTGRTV